MILQNYDPASIKLFSKCARNHASKLLNHRTHSATRPYSSQIVCSEKQKKKKVVCSFDMSESREQRNKKFQSIKTPAVGHYNPITENKVKLTWDILKIYEKRNQSRKSTLKQEQSRLQIKTEHFNKEDEIANAQGQQNQEIVGIQTSQTENFPTQNCTTEPNNLKKQSRYMSKKRQTENRRYIPVRSNVDMSRMTGRESPKHLTEQDANLMTQQLDVQKSIQYIKPKKSEVTIDFNRQISREKINSLNKPINVPSDYSYDYKLVRPKGSSSVNFYKTIGRNELNKSLKEQVYGYTHYDYEKYVWKSKSNVFNNTKTHIIDFRKQSNRPIFKQ